MRQLDPFSIVLVLVGAGIVGALLGVLVEELEFRWRTRGRRRAPGEAKRPQGAGPAEGRIARLFGWPQAKAAWGSVGVMLICLVAGLIGVGWRVYEGGPVLFSALGMLDAEQAKLGMRIITASAVVAAALPLYLPRLASAGRGAALGVMTGLMAGIATPLFDRMSEFAFLIILTSTVSLATICVISALVAFVLAAGVAFVARRLVSGREAGSKRRGYVVAAGAVGLLVFGAYAFWPQAVAWHRTDPDYRLAPSTWKGEIVVDRPYPFTLVVEQVRPDGQFTGFMDWERNFRLKIEGKATANHLVFMDTEVLRGDGSFIGIYDRKDVWIKGTSMAGTDKNGRAKLTAELVAPGARGR